MEAGVTNPMPPRQELSAPIDAPVSYDAQGRMRFHPAYHHRHKASWTTLEQKYLIENYETDGPEAVSLALGRTIGVIMTRVWVLRRDGKMRKPTKRRWHQRSRMGAS